MKSSVAEGKLAEPHIVNSFLSIDVKGSGEGGVKYASAKLFLHVLER